MKKLLAFLLVACLSLALVACSQENSSGKATVVICGETQVEYTVDIDKIEVTEGVLSILKYLKDNENLTLEYSNGTYGAFLSKVGELSPGQSEYISIFTSVEKDFDVSGYAQVREYKGTTLKTAGVGASSLTVQDGAIYYFEILTF